MALRTIVLHVNGYAVDKVVKLDLSEVPDTARTTTKWMASIGDMIGMARPLEAHGRDKGLSLGENECDHGETLT